MNDTIEHNGYSFIIPNYNDIEEEEIKEDYFKCWIVAEDGSLVPSKRINVIEPGGMKAGVWTIEKTQGGMMLIPEEISNDSIVKLPNQEVASVVEELNRFWGKSELFEKYGITHKRGILLHGPPGTGKSSIIDMIARECIKQNGLVFYIRHRNDLLTFIDFAHCELKQLEGSRKILTIIEDLDNIATQDLATVLAFLDGEDEVQHNVVLATTNHIKEMTDVLTRPSRFDWIVEINNPTEADRRAFLKDKFKFDEGPNLDKWVRDTEDLSLATLNEMFIAVVLLENNYDEVLSRMKDHTKLVSKNLYKSKSSKGGVGFAFGVPPSNQ